MDPWCWLEDDLPGGNDLLSGVVRNGLTGPRKCPLMGPGSIFADG